MQISRAGGPSPALPGAPIRAPGDRAMVALERAVAALALIAAILLSTAR
jgi:hypothetical protein